jgi:GDP-L-fucose synthase
MSKPESQNFGAQEHSRILPQHSRIFLAGHRGMVGSAIHRRLQADNYGNIITRSHDQLDLTNQAAVRHFFQNEKIDAVILAAAKVGGIHANETYRAEFIFENIMIQTNVVHEAYRSGVQRLLFLGSSCIYPKYAEQPMREELLLTGRLEPTNEPYAVAKIAGINLCESYNFQYGTHYRSVMPTNLYGPHDNFDLEDSHVLPAMLRKFHLTKLARDGNWEQIQKDQVLFGRISADFLKGLKQVSGNRGLDLRQPISVRLWGSGRPKREFLHVDDLAAACLFVFNLRDEVYEAACTIPVEQTDRPPEEEPLAFSNADLKDRNRVSHLNVGSGKDIRIAQLAEIVQEVVGYAGPVSWNTSMPDGTPRKLLDVSRLTQLGWTPRISLKAGIKSTYQWYLAQSELI